MKHRLFTVLAVVLLLLTGAASAQQRSEGNWLIRARAIYVDPNVSTDGVLSAMGIGASGQWAPELDLTYFFTRNIALELIAATTKHDVSSFGADIGSVKVLPPTLTLQYHFTDLGAFKPYVGVGLNYTHFYDQNLLAGAVKVDGSSWGAALQAGLDYSLDKNWVLNADVKYIWMKTDASMLGVPLGTLTLNPWVFGVGVGYRF